MAREPEWLGGLVYAPWVPCTLEELRARTPARYPIRNYPDVTHSLNCQFPVEDWDPAFALTLGRECYNPRPVAEKHIHNLQAPHVIGNLVYSEGINDDINKLIWLDQDWDPDRPVIETLREIGRLFVGPDLCEGVAQGLMALERNWRGPLAANGGVETTLAQWQAMERQGGGAALASYRFKMGLQRAYYDAYVRRRLLHESDVERQALEILEKAPAGPAPVTGGRRSRGSAAAILRRRQAFDSTSATAAGSSPTSSLLRSAGRPPCRATRPSAGREALSWTASTCPSTTAGGSSPSSTACAHSPTTRRAAQRIRAIVERTNPGPGGFYHNLGTAGGLGDRGARARADLGARPRLDGCALCRLRAGGPAPLLRRAVAGQGPARGAARLDQLRVGELPHAAAPAATPAVESGAPYRLRVVYFKCRHAPLVRLLAGGIVVHEALRVGDATMDAGLRPGPRVRDPARSDARRPAGPRVAAAAGHPHVRRVGDLAHARGGT